MIVKILYCSLMNVFIEELEKLNISYDPSLNDKECSRFISFGTSKKYTIGTSKSFDIYLKKGFVEKNVTKINSSNKLSDFLNLIKNQNQIIFDKENEQNDHNILEKVQEVHDRIIVAQKDPSQFFFIYKDNGVLGAVNNREKSIFEYSVKKQLDLLKNNDIII